MKRILSILLTLFLVLSIDNVYASSFSPKITGNDTFEKDITLNLQVNSLSGFDTSACKGLCGLTGKLEYDSSKIELSSIKALQGFDLTQGKQIVLYKTTGVKSGTKILEMKFKNKSLKKDEKTTIKFTSIVGSDGDNDIKASDATKTIKLVVKTSTSTSTSTTKKNTTVKTTPKPTVKPVTKSSNNNIKGITLSTGNIDFKEDILTYDVTVANDVKTITIDTTLSDSKATITNLGVYELQEGNNPIELVVTAEDGSTKTYTINVYRDKEVLVDNNEVVKKPEEKTNNYLVEIILALIVIGIGIVVIVTKKKVNQER